MPAPSSHCEAANQSPLPPKDKVTDQRGDKEGDRERDQHRVDWMAADARGRTGVGHARASGFPFGRTPLLKPSSLPREDDTGHVTLGEPAVRALDEFGIQADAA
jgi:hypothetical protein